MRILVTGSAGFIGYHLTKRLLRDGHYVIGFDNINSYYDQSLKMARLSDLDAVSSTCGRFDQINEDLENFDALNKLFATHNPSIVVHLAAQAGVRYSLENPSSYLQSNVSGFGNILEVCRHNNVEHLIYASSSSVYGGNKFLPYSEDQRVDKPVSLYAATKKANELMAHAYSHLFGLPTTGLRFFTVYGPWGRPDMALFSFTKSILEGSPINLYNNGNMIRDFTYIDDIIEAIVRLLEKPSSSPQSDKLSSDDCVELTASYQIFNIGNSRPTPLLEYVEALEEALGIRAKKNYLPMQPGDVENTAADTSRLYQKILFKPNTSIKVGVARFVEWYRDYYNI